MSRTPAFFSVVVFAVTAASAVACATSPAMRSPLREQLDTAETPAVEDAARACLNGHGWAADPIGSYSSGANVVTATNKEKVTTQVYIYGRDQKPRVTGGPDDEKFWRCLASKLGGGADEATGGDGGPTDNGGAATGAEGGAPTDKPAPKEPGDKGGAAS